MNDDEGDEGEPRSQQQGGVGQNAKGLFADSGGDRGQGKKAERRCGNPERHTDKTRRWQQNTGEPNDIHGVEQQGLRIGGERAAPQFFVDRPFLPPDEETVDEAKKPVGDPSPQGG